jgi:hypothetical protein
MQRDSVASSTVTALQLAFAGQVASLSQFVAQNEPISAPWEMQRLWRLLACGWAQSASRSQGRQ